MKRFLKRHWPLVGLCAVIFLAGFYFVKSGKDLLKAPALLKNLMLGEGIKLEDVHYAQDNPDDKIKWVVDAREVRFSGDRKNVEFFDFRLKVEPDDRPWFKLNGKKGNYSKDTGKIELFGSIEGFSSDGYRILTEYLLVNEKAGHLSTDKPVKIFGPFFEVVGRGLSADLKKEKIKVLSNVTTNINLGSHE
jgi:LPS export ABC transporter protein LptC